MQAFHCNRCGQSLRIDDSLTDLDDATTDLLMGPLIAEEQYQKQNKKTTPQIQDGNQASNPKPLHQRVVGGQTPAARSGKHNRETFNGGPSDSFVVLSRSQATPPNQSTPGQPLLQPQTVPATDDKQWQNQRNNNLTHRLRVAKRLFDLMSSKSSVDHPMCHECTDMLLESLEKQLEDVGRERDYYIDFLKKVKDGRVSQEEERELVKQVKELVVQEEQVTTLLKQEEAKRDGLAKQLEEMENEMKELNERDEEFWEKSNAYQLSLQTFQNQRDSINLKYDHDVKQYERLQKTVVYNDAFSISHDGPFGTINGFRLGRLGSHTVEWAEVNAAWGQTLLLLYTVANKLKFQFQTYRLVPMGSFSRVEKIDGDSVLSYELYGSGDFGINRMFLNRRFDHAMVAILNCLKQLTDFAEERDKSLRLPYRINKDKIGELSIRLQFNQEELWTKALKYMLTNMKWILAFASRTIVTADVPTS
ncbi:autophagy protein Apg6-domain-containing protein [Phycomyces nitens]|nr:autophagy protein Apg6-domain-containing protein [Phycomyces nitens]